MNGIFKRRKTGNFAQIENEGLQTLTDIRSIGVLSHLMSFPENWVVQKMQLYKKFGKGHMEKAIAELEKRKYWVSIKYRSGSLNYYNYTISDFPFADHEVIELIERVREAKFEIKEISEAFRHLLISVGECLDDKGEEGSSAQAELQSESNRELKSAQNSIADDQPMKEEDDKSIHVANVGQPLKKGVSVCDQSITVFQQLKINHSNSIVEKRQLIKKDLKINSKQIHKQQREIVNLQERTHQHFDPKEFKIALTNACNEYYPKYASGRWSKKAWMTLIEAFVTETIETGRYKNVLPVNLHRYAQASIENIVHNNDFRQGKNKLSEKFSSVNPILLFNWLE